jgi:ribosomal protein S18 acetylase RimI-like enzyme
MLHTRPFCSEDEQFLFDLYTSTRAEELRLWDWNKSTKQEFLTLQWKAQQQFYLMQYPNTDHQIILLKNIRIGRILLSDTDNDIRLVDLSLLPDSRNLGIGTTLLKHLQTEASVTNRPIRLSVLKQNPAKRLYERIGFSITGDNDIYAYMEWRMW